MEKRKKNTKTHGQRVREQMRRLYTQGMPPKEIALLLNCSDRTVYHHKRKDRENGYDWDEVRLDRAIGDEQYEAKHRQFLWALFECFESDLAALREEGDPSKRLDLLDKYSTSYYKLMASARKAEPGTEISEVVGKTLKMLADQAMEEEREDVVRFILNRLDTLPEDIKKTFSK